MSSFSRVTRRQLLLGSTAAVAASAGIVPAAAQTSYPTRPVRVVVPYPPAGGADTVSRILFHKLGQLWGQQFVIENRGGAGGTIGEAVVAKAEPDGYTVLYDPSLYQKLSFDYVKDFQPVFLASMVSNLLVVNNSVPAYGVADVIALGKAALDGLDFASSGNGTVQHLCLEMFRHRTGIRINHIPYRGGGPALNDLISGQVKFFFSNAASSMGHVQTGMIRAIAHTGRGRLKPLPDLPAVAETLSGFEAYEWNGVFVPAGTPLEIICKLNFGLNATLEETDVRERLNGLSVEVRENTAEEFRSFVASEMDKWQRVVREANVKLG
ncbi:MAG: tripartite tricarboxylate transporter substrate-binding protein [Xanthobacteraceae bacterium]